MKITFLGTGAGSPSRARNVTSIALQLPQQARLWLFDCGEATQHQILRSPLRLSQLERMFFTHLHGDHIFGLPGLLASRSMQNGGTTPVVLYGPQGLGEYVRCTMEISQSHLAFPLSVVPVREGRNGAVQTVYEDDGYRVESLPVAHRIEAYGYAVVEKDQVGHFDVDKARAMNIPAGPLFGRLKKGETVTLDDGRTLDGREFIGPTIKGRRMAYCGDTIYTPNAIELARNADVLIHEATFLHDELPQAERSRHSTAVMAAQVAQRANVKTLILTHFSARYEAGQQLEVLLDEARLIFPNTILAHDFLTYDVPRREED
jgi:ribonuclease Z